MPVWFGLLLGLLPGIWQTTPLAGVAHPPAENMALLAKVDAHYNHLASLRTRYTERYDGLGLVRTESGTLLLKRPGRMLWRYDSPAGKVFVLDGKFAWFYTPGDAQASRAPAKQLDDLRTPLRFLLGHTQLKKELQDISVQADGDGYRISGVPRGTQKVKQLILLVTTAGQIIAMRIDETGGSTTAFTFTNIEENVPASDSDFAFKPPAGVTVVDAMPPI